MNKMTVDVKQSRAVRLNVNDVVVPDLVIQSARLARGLNHFSSSLSRRIYPPECAMK
jgi:hypothetical protein